MGTQQWYRSSGNRPAVRAWLLPFAGLVLGGLAGGVYGTFCGGINSLVHGTLDTLVAWGVGCAVGGAVAGAVVGLCRMVDHVVTEQAFETDPDDYGDDRPHPTETDPPPLLQATSAEREQPVLVGQGRAFCNPLLERMNRGTI